MNVQTDGHARPRRVLVVDDDPTFREMMSYALHQQHIDVRMAQNGTEALKMLQEDLFDLLLTDFQMPGMNGLEVAAAARQLHVALPIVLLTGSGGTFSPADLDGAGIAQLFTKPFDLKELMHWIYLHVPGANDGQLSSDDKV